MKDLAEVRKVKVGSGMCQRSVNKKNIRLSLVRLNANTPSLKRRSFGFKRHGIIEPLKPNAYILDAFSTPKVHSLLCCICAPSVPYSTAFSSKVFSLYFH